MLTAPRPVFGPNDHHLEKDPHSDRYTAEPGLGDAEASVIRARRGLSAQEIDAYHASTATLTATTAQLDDARAQIAALEAQLAAKVRRPTG